MTDAGVEEFVIQFAAAWASRDGAAFRALWHPEGTLFYPLAARPIRGDELERLNEILNATAPDLVWQLIDWTTRGDVLIIEWQATRFVGGRRFDWRGVDKLRLKAGKIVEERVYMDTALLRALRTETDTECVRQAARLGIAHEPLIAL